MANDETGMAVGVGSGALGGAAAGMAFGGPAGAVVGAFGGGIGGWIATQADRDAQEAMERALARAESQYNAAVATYESSVSQAAAGAKEMLNRTMTSKGAADASAVSAAISEAERGADKAGLIGAEKADAVSKTRERVEQARASSSPSVAQQALGAANQSRAQEIQKAGMQLQSAQNKYNSDIQQISSQEIGGNAAAFGQALGAVAQAGLAYQGSRDDLPPGGGGGGDASDSGWIDPERMAKEGGQNKLGGSAAKPAAANLGSIAPTTPAVTAPGGTVTQPNMEIGTVAGPDTSGSMFERAGGGAPPVGTVPVNLGESDDSGTDYMNWLTGFPQSQQTFPGTAGVELKAGGMAGTQGPEVALLGEEGPELVLNAKQTRELGKALGSAKPLAMGGVAGYDDEDEISGYAGGGVAGAQPRPQSLGGPPAGVMAQDPEELEAYLNELLSRAG
tara:strand:- start:1414 stop:2760 length:1347 start_codon:yes stop_codon:yes gene_type:complete